jgi:hypothetical protein
MTRGLGLLHVDASMFRYVRYWHKAGIKEPAVNVRFRG